MLCDDKSEVGNGKVPTFADVKQRRAPRSARRTLFTSARTQA